MVKHGVLFFILNTSYYEGGVTMSKWYRFRKVKNFIDIIRDLAAIVGNIYCLSTDIYKIKTGKRPNFDED